MNLVRVDERSRDRRGRQLVFVDNGADQLVVTFLEAIHLKQDGLSRL